MPRHNIIPQMFDIRPVNETGDLDWEKIRRIDRNLMLELKKLEETEKKAEEMLAEMKINEPKNPAQKHSYNFERIYSERYYHRELPVRQSAPRKAQVFKLGEKFESDDIPLFYESSYAPSLKADIEIKEELRETGYDNAFISEELLEIEENKKRRKRKIGLDKLRGSFRFSDLFFPAKFNFNFSPRKYAFYFAAFSLLIAVTIGGYSFGMKGLKIKGEVLGDSQEGYASLSSAIDGIKSQNFESSGLQFEKSYQKFSEASKNLDEMGNFFIDMSKYFPFSSKLSSGKNLVEAGKHISTAGQSLNKILKIINSLKNPLADNGGQNVSLLEIFKSTKEEIAVVNQELQEIQENLDNVSLDDIPQDKRSQFAALKEKLPEITKLTNGFLDNSEIFVDLLGGNGPRKYFFLFQNNQEMRATGGFIGSYGLMDISAGRIRNFFIDGIFNPDGQLQDKIIPPKPIQKISAAWSLHDSNWFPNFPSSAKEAIRFYEKTGGPTADGVITLTPTVMQKLLEITGPIEMKDYGITIDSDNFIQKTQEEVEINYDKEENKPKKILSDLAPIILDKIFNARDPRSIMNTLNVFSQGLSEKQILIFSQNENLQKIISDRGWSGEVLGTQKDYLSVINTNINGFKTDGVIDESIAHNAEIQPDGSIIDTVKITRHHNGGNSDYEWWNKVNADYMRVYVPLGSKFLSVEGQTREKDESPLDYSALGFKKDPLVQAEEDHLLIDENSGTRIYEDSGKTVFANWTYVSPQETMEITYKYLLPFRINVSDKDRPADSYSLLAQKQSGSLGSNFSSEITFPKNYDVAWNYPENIKKENGVFKLEAKLDTDKFIGLVFTKNNAILNN